MGFKVLMDIANNITFQNRVKYALENAAIAVMAEAGNTAGHALRVTYANKVLLGQASIFEMSVGVLNNSTIASEANLNLADNAAYGIPDSDIQFAVNSIFNAYAGVAN